MRMFNALISEMKLEGIPLVGRKFTWYKSNGTMRSRIDRVLATRDWLESWPQCAQWVLDRNVSNHCPIVVKSSSIDCGPKPFRFLNCQLTDKRFGGVSKELSKNLQFEGWGGYVLKEKIKGLKKGARRSLVINKGDKIRLKRS